MRLRDVSWFDRKILLAKRRVSGLNPESKAFKAGVREGQQVLGMSIQRRDVSKPYDSKSGPVTARKQSNTFREEKQSQFPSTISMKKHGLRHQKPVHS